MIYLFTLNSYIPKYAYFRVQMQSKPKEYKTPTFEYKFVVPVQVPIYDITNKCLIRCPIDKRKKK